MSRFVDVIDVQDLFKRLGLDDVSLKSGGSEVSASCPFHTDNRPSFFMNATTTAWFCWSCKSKGRDCLNFVMRVLGVTETEVMTFLMDTYGVDFQQPVDGDMLAEMHRLLEPPAFPADPFRPPSDSWLETVTYDLWSGVGVEALAYAHGRGFDDPTLKNWEFGYDVFSDRLVVAVRNFDSELIGFKGRRMDEQKDHKYDVLGDVRGGRAHYGFDTYDAVSNVFGLDRERLCPTAVLLEGEFNAAALHQWGVVRPVALGMSWLSDHHARMLIAAVDHVVLFPDPDKAGSDFVPATRAKLDYDVRVSVVEGHDGDPLEMGRERTLWHLNQARSAIEVDLDKLFISR